VQGLGVGHGFPARTHVRLGDDLQQGRAGAVQVDAGHAVEVFVQALAGVLFQVGAGDADGFFHAVAGLVADLDGQAAALDDGQLELADLVALGQVGVEVILAGEDVGAVEFGADGQAEA
jgi:hypothetical protein